MLRYIRRNDALTPFPRPSDMPEALHRLLMARGIDSAEAAERFLNPDARSLHDPLLLSDMACAVQRIRAAMDAGETICVYGDYDVDGVCASSIMLLWLKAQGADARVYLPSRHSEGYGLNEAAIRAIAEWAKLLVTVDCGVTSVELVALAKSLGLSVIVTDHHRPIEAPEGSPNPFTLPDCPVVNPLLNGYPFPSLCGAGVAWKLVWALSGELPLPYVDIAALATVADVVPLTGENRAIVAMGLNRINREPRSGIAALIEVAGLSGKPVTSTAIAFQLAPRLNAGGRLGSALRALELVTAEDAQTARPLAGELDQENEERRRVERDILREAEAQIEGFDFIRHRALILAGKDWNPGVIGLAASRLVEQYHYPVVMLADQGDRMTGSCRSIEGVDIHAALTGCAEHLVKFGGHKQAAGLTLLPEKLPDFIAAMDEWLSTHIAPGVYVPTAAYDDVLSFEEVTPGLIASLEALQPTGFGNPAPVFRAQAAVIEARAVGMDGAHLKLMLSQGGHRLDGIAFREGAQARTLSGDCPVDALFVPKLNTYMGRTTAQLEVKALASADNLARIRSKKSEAGAMQCEFLTNIIYNRKIIPLEGAVSEIALDALADRLAREPQGTLIVVGDLGTAERLAEAFAETPPDLYLGELPNDPRAFNALCVCPPTGAIGPGWRRVVLAAAPKEWLTPPLGAEVYRVAGLPEWAGELPDLEALRDTYRALMDLAQRPVRFYDLGQLANLAAADNALSAPCALASLLAMIDMGLFDVRFDKGAGALKRLNRKKVDPEASGVWRAIQRWKMDN